MQPRTAHVLPTASSLRHPTRPRAASHANEDCHNSTSVVAPAAAAAAAPVARQFLERAHQLLLSHDRPSPGDYKRLVDAYTLALHQAQSPGRLDVAACFVAHVRLAHLSFGNDGRGYYGGGSSSGDGSKGGGNSSSIAHLEAAWKLRDHLPPSSLGGALDVYFRAVRLKLASLHDQQDALRRSSSGGRGNRKFDVDEKDGSTESGNRSKPSLAVLRSVANLCAPGVERDRGVEDARGEDATAGATKTTGMNLGGGDRGPGAPCNSVCDGCRDTSHSGGDANAAVPAATAAAERRRDRARGRYCRACTQAYDKAVAQGPVNDGTPCAGCEDRTQPVTIEPDGAWYCEACIEEFYEEQEEENEGRRDAKGVLDAGEAGGGVASPAESGTPADKAGSAACGDQTVTLSAEGLTGSTGRDWAISC